MELIRVYKKQVQLRKNTKCFRFQEIMIDILQSQQIYAQFPNLFLPRFLLDNYQLYQIIMSDEGNNIPQLSLQGDQPPQTQNQLSSPQRRRRRNDRVKQSRDDLPKKQDEPENVKITSPQKQESPSKMEEQQSPVRLIAAPKLHQDQSSRVLDQSYIGLKNEGSEANLLSPPPKRERKKNGARVKLPRIGSQENEEALGTGFTLQQSPEKQSPTKGSPTKIRKSRKIPPGYQMANLDDAIKYWNSMAYNKKTVGEDGEPEYVDYQICDDLEELRQYGLGVFLYLEFMKRLFIVCVVLSAIMILPLYINYNGTGLSDYTDSFSLTQAKFTIGNLTSEDRKTYIMLSAADFLAMIILFFFYMHWRRFHNDLVEESDKDHSILNPTIYAVSVIGFDKKTQLLEENLKAYIDGLFRGAYEVEIVYNFKRNFNKFIDLQEHIEKIQKEKQVIKQTEKGNEDLIEFEKELLETEKEVEEVAQEFEPIYAIIHFRNLKAKFAFVNMCKKYALVDSFGYKLRRCLCCMPELPERQKFLGKDELIIKSTNLARPEEYNWNNIDITSLSRAARMALSILIIIICIAITSTLVAICTLYVSSTSSCSEFDDATTLDEAQSAEDQLTMYCYCSAHYTETFSDEEIDAACSDISNDILVSNIVQSGASAVSAITNVMLIVIVSLVAQYLYKPQSKPKQFSFIFVAVFISNYINAALLPLILNGSIEGFQTVEYMRFVKFINHDNVTIFKDFQRDWYAIISPYYTMFFVVAAISPIIQLAVFSLKRTFVMWRVKKMAENTNPHDPSIQKQANNTIISFPFDFPTECAIITLQLFMTFMYSALIPLAIPIFTVGLLINFICKRYIIIHYTVRIPANQDLNEKIYKIFPFVILLHGLMGIWARTADGIFSSDAYIVKVNFGYHNQYIDRAISDIVMLAVIGLILLWIIFDFTVITFFGTLSEMCKDELELPVTMAAVENTNYADRLRKSNILGSYKLSNNPTFKHAFKAYKDLEKRLDKEKKLAAGHHVEDVSSIMDH